MKTAPKPKRLKLIGDRVLDGLVRTFIRMTSRGYCQRCQKYVGEQIQTCHIYRRHRKTVRWDLRNVWGLCLECHIEIDNDHIAKTSFMYDVMSGEDIADLQRLANMTIKEYPIDRTQIKQELQEKIKGE